MPFKSLVGMCLSLFGCARHKLRQHQPATASSFAHKMCSHGLFENHSVGTRSVGDRLCQEDDKETHLSFRPRRGFPSPASAAAGAVQNGLPGTTTTFAATSSSTTSGPQSGSPEGRLGGMAKAHSSEEHSS
eukprot:581972-Pelagomonas_calceolata.AAC.2